MIVSETPKRSNTRWLQACVLLCAMVVLPLGIASAQDYEAVEKRLGEGVAMGELTLKQASVMMDALKKAGGLKKDQGSDRAKAYLMKVKKELGELVEAGEISREAAARRYEGAEKRVKERMAAGRRERQRGARGERERGERRFTREDYARAEEKMRKMAEEGKAKPEDVERRLIEMRKMMGRQRERGARDERERGERGITVEEYRRAEEKMRKMVEEGKAKPEDVERRLIEMRKMIGGQSKRGGERQRTTRGDKRTEYEGFERRIRAAVEAGKMTREEAREKLEGYKKRIGR